MTLSLDAERVDREFLRHIRSEYVSDDPVAMAATPAFEVEPVPLRVFLREQRYLGVGRVSEEQFGALLHAERVYFEPTYQVLGWDPVRMVNELGLAWGKGCLPHDTPVMTPSGWSRHGDLQVGDEVIGGDGLPCRVLTVFPDVWEDCYRITFSDGESLVATSGHRWPMLYRDRGEQLVTTEEMARCVERSHGAHRSRVWVQEYGVPVELPEAALSVDPYLLGLWLGDGQTQAQINIADAEVAQAFAGAGYAARRVSGTEFRYGVTGGFQTALRGLGVLGQKRIPVEYLRGSIDQRLALLQGLMDTDGSAGRRLTFSNTNRNLIDGVCELLSSLGVGWRVHEDAREGRSVCWSVSFVVYRDVLPVFRLQRKLDRQMVTPVQKRGYSQARRVVSVDRVPTVPARSIEVGSADSIYRVGRTGLMTHNSGKDFVSRCVLSRIVYLLQCLESPQGYFGMPGTEFIHLTNIATSAPQARVVFFQPWLQMLGGSAWFRDRMEPLTTAINFDKGIYAQSGHSSVESQEGQNLICAVIDEFSGFKTAAELMSKRRVQDREPAQSAEGIYKTALSSIRSRFPLTGKLIALSFTRFRNDPIDLLERRGRADLEKKGPASRFYVSRAATWEVNPTRKRSDFDQDFEDDPADAACRYMCQPSASPHRYFQNLVALRRSMGIPLDTEDVWKLDPVVGVQVFYEYRPEVSPEPDDVGPALPGWEVDFDFTGLIAHRKACAIHVDLGITQDLCGVSMAHVEEWYTKNHTLVDPETRLEEVVPERRPRVVVDFTLAFEQQRGDLSRQIPSSDIQIRWVRDLIFTLIREGWNIRMVTMDGYQSTDTLQLLERQSIIAELYSLDRKTEGYDILKNLIYGADVQIPFHPLAFTELESLVKINDRKIDHQAGMSKDMADSLAGAVRGATQLIEEGYGVGETEAVWSGASQDELLAEFLQAGDSAAPRDYAAGEDGEFWSGGGEQWQR